MAAAAIAAAPPSSRQQQRHHQYRQFRLPSIPNRPSLSLRRPTAAYHLQIHNTKSSSYPFIAKSIAGGGGDGGNNGGNGNGGGGEGSGDGGEMNRREAILALASMGRSLDSLPSDLAAAVRGFQGEDLG